MSKSNQHSKDAAFFAAIWASKVPHLNRSSRLDRAVDLVRNGHVKQGPTSDLFTVVSSGRDTTYTVRVISGPGGALESNCSCPDSSIKAFHCKHRLAAALLVKVALAAPRRHAADGSLAIPQAPGASYYDGTASLPCSCGGTVVWAENGYTPGARACTSCRRLHMVRGTGVERRLVPWWKGSRAHREPYLVPQDFFGTAPAMSQAHGH